MNVLRVKSLLTKEYGNLDLVRPSVFRATRHRDGHIVAICFFDCSKELTKADFDLQSYQDALLSEDYYRNSGPIQWNYYLYLLCDPSEYDALWSRGTAFGIEADTVYARKYVLTEEQLEHEIPGRGKVWGGMVEKLPEDISVRWIERLREHKLDGVFIEGPPLTQVVDRYIEGKPMVEDEAVTVNIVRRVHEVLPSIQALRIDDGYRAYPLERKFSFGLANLVEGVNGSGKTSLLEAIELWICGRTARNPDDVNERSAGISLKLLGGTRFEPNTRGDNSIFRARDIAWYGNAYVKGNRLCYGFRRFNFYDTDAATRLTANTLDAAAIRGAFADLVVGQQASFIEARLHSAKDRFEERYRTLKTKVGGLDPQVREARDQLDSLSSDQKTRREILRQFHLELETAGWTDPMPDASEVSLGSFHKRLAGLCAVIDECQEQVGWLPSPSLPKIRSEGRVLDGLVSRIDSLNQQLHDCSVALEKGSEGIRATLLSRTSLQRVRSYATDRESSRLLGLDQSIDVKRRELARSRKATDIIRTVHLSDYAPNRVSIGRVLSSKEELLARLRERSIALKRELALLTKRQGSIVRVRADLLSKGMEITSQCPNMAICPLCGASYDKGELRRRIRKQQSLSNEADEVNRQLSATVTRMRAVDRRIETTEKHRDEVGAIERAVSVVLDESQCSNLSVRKAVNILETLPERCRRLSGDLDELLALKDRLNNRGLSEKEYQVLTDWLSNDFAKAKVREGTLSRVDRLSDKIDEELASLEAARKRLEKKKLSILERKKALLRSYFASTPLEECDWEHELLRRLARLRGVLEISHKELAAVLRSPNETFPHIRVRLRQSGTSYDRFRESIRSLTEATEQRAKLEGKLQRLLPQLNKAKRMQANAEHAIATISEILENDSKEMHLRQFLEDNVRQIAEIFRSLHSPREFSQIDLNDADGQLLLIREGSQMVCPVTRMSSGQRSALALSVFLTLNSKLRNGPPLILLDDPVPQVDDLNALSLLDYLREICLVGRRQTVFATASRKLGTLFRKKFQCLGNDFVSISLRREGPV